MIGAGPDKASHTAVVINAAEEPLGELRVRASAVQAERLLAWAQAWPQRTWAVEGAGGVGRLLAQQLLAAGERGKRCAAQAGRPGAAAGDREHRQERSQRCALGGGRGAALRRLPGG